MTRPPARPREAGRMNEVGAIAMEPPVPIDLDLRGFRWMKLDLLALFNSDFNATPDDTAWRAGVTLWGKAWHQVPAGSLPDDDATLCNLAGLGRDIKTWRRIRPAALRGFVVCSDGRLYHSYVCRIAKEAHMEQERFEKRRRADRERKSPGISGGIPAENPPEIPVIPPEDGERSSGNPADSPGEGAERSGAENLRTVSDETVPKRAARQKVRSRIDEERPPSVADIGYAESKGYPKQWVSEQWERFRDYHIREGSLMADWPAAWRTWVQNAKKFNGVNDHGKTDQANTEHGADLLARTRALLGPAPAG